MIFSGFSGSSLFVPKWSVFKHQITRIIIKTNKPNVVRKINLPWRSVKSLCHRDSCLRFGLFWWAWSYFYWFLLPLKLTKYISWDITLQNHSSKADKDLFMRKVPRRSIPIMFQTPSMMEPYGLGDTRFRLSQQSLVEIPHLSPVQPTKSLAPCKYLVRNKVNQIEPK